MKHESTPSSDAPESKHEVGRLSLLTPGFGIHMGWCYAAMYGSITVFGLDPSLQGSTPNGWSLLFLCSLLMFAATLIIAGLCAHRVRRALISKRGSIASCALMITGTLLATAAGLVGAPAAAEALTVAAGVVTGLGSALMFLFWGTALAVAEFPTAIANLACALVLSFCIYAGLAFVPAPVSGLLTAVLPLLELAVLWRLRPSFFMGDNPLPVLESLPIRAGSFAVHVVPPVACFGIALGLLSAATFADAMEVRQGSDALCLVAAAVLAAAVVVGVQVLFIAKHNTSTFFKHLLPVIAVCACAVPLASFVQWAAISDMAVLVAFIALNILLLSLFCDLSQSYRLNPLYIFGLGRGTMALAMLLGASIATGGTRLLPTFMSGGSQVAVVMLFLLLGLCTLPSRPTIERASRNACSMTFYYQGQGGKGPSLLGSKVQADNVTRAIGAQRPGAATAASSRGLVREAAGTLEDPIPLEELLQAQCEAIANCYLLSQRETEVFYYLAKGLNSAAIQEQLCISKGTAKTHIRHIYRKLDIHSQQELIEMVDATLVGGV